MKKVILSLLVILFTLISITSVFLFIRNLKIVINDVSLLVIYPTPTYYGRSYTLNYTFSTNTHCDTTFFHEIWLIDSCRFREEYSDPQHFSSTIVKLRNGSDTLYVFFLGNDTVYAICDVAVQQYRRNVSYLLPKSVLEEPRVVLPSTLNTSNMTLFFNERKEIHDIHNSEFSIWRDTRNHILLHYYLFEDSVGRRTEQWYWMAWNVYIPESLLVIADGSVVTNKDKSFYSILFPQGPEIVRKSFTIPPVSTWWFFFRIYLKRLFS